MKKHLIAAAVVSAFAVPAMAQNVSMYGVIEYTVASQKVGSDSQTVQGAAAGRSLSTTVFGIRGSEDLGGGLSAMFDLQADLNNNNGFLGKDLSVASNGTNVDSTGSTTVFSRQSWVGLSSKTLGTIKLGRQSDVLDSTEGFANFNQVFDTEAANANGIGEKNANTTRYDSPSFGGLTIAVSYTNGADNLPANKGNIITTYGVQYASGPLTIGLASGSATLSSATINGKLDTFYGGYDFGVANIRAQYTRNKAAAGSNGANFTETKTSEISAAIPLAALGAGVSAVVHAESASVDNQSGAVANSDYKQYGFTLQKDLSKRTTAYVAFRDKNLDGTGSDETISSVGVRHTF